MGRARSFEPWTLFLIGLALPACVTAGSQASIDASGRLLAGARGALAPDQMRLHIIDVGQGDAALFEFACGAVLYDTGGESDALFESRGVLLAYLDTFFRENRPDLGGRLSSLILSHPHIDHTRNVIPVLERYRPRNIVTNGQVTEVIGGPEQVAAHRYADTRKLPRLEIANQKIGPRGFTNEVLDPVACEGVDPVITALWGWVEQDPGWHDDDYGRPVYDNANNHSIVLRVDFGQASFLFTGDLEHLAIEDMVQRYEGTSLLDVDVYQVGHHGSHNGTSESLVKAMSPELALFSMGPPDRELSWTAWKYGHPRVEAVEMLEQEISQSRPPIDVLVGKWSRKFEPRKVAKAIYGTGWDGSLIVEVGADGALKTRRAGRGP